MQYEPAASPVPGTPAAHRRSPGTTDTAMRRARPFTIKTSGIGIKGVFWQPITDVSHNETARGLAQR